MPSLSDLTLQAYMSVFELRLLDKEVGSKDGLQVNAVEVEKKAHVKVGVDVVAVSCEVCMTGEVAKVKQASATVDESESDYFHARASMLRLPWYQNLKFDPL